MEHIGVVPQVQLQKDVSRASLGINKLVESDSDESPSVTSDVDTVTDISTRNDLRLATSESSSNDSDVPGDTSETDLIESIRGRLV